MSNNSESMNKNINGKNDMNLSATLFSGYPDVVDIKQLQKMFGIGRHAAYDLVNSGAIPALKIGKTIHILKINIIKYIENNTLF